MKTKTCQTCGTSFSVDVGWKKGRFCEDCYQKRQTARNLHAYRNDPIARAKQIIWSQNTRAARLKIEPIPLDQGVSLLMDTKECPYCLLPNSDDVVFEIDHIIPVSRGGTNDMSNIQVCCQWCNGIKKNKPEAEFKAWLAGTVQRLK